MRYTKKQRNEIYKKSLNFLNEKGFLCHSMEKALKNNFVGQQWLLDNFPELCLFAPDGKYCYVWGFCERIGASIWDNDNQLPRQIVLDFCILMTE